MLNCSSVYFPLVFFDPLFRSVLCPRPALNLCLFLRQVYLNPFLEDESFYLKGNFFKIYFEKNKENRVSRSHLDFIRELSLPFF